MELKELEDLKHATDVFRDSMEEYFKAIQDENCDKYELTFNTEDRFTVFSTKVFLSNHIGYYGNAGCSKKISVYSNVIGREYFLKYINIHVKEILKGMLELMEKDVEENKGIKIKQLREELAVLEGSSNSIKKQG